MRYLFFAFLLVPAFTLASHAQVSTYTAVPQGTYSSSALNLDNSALAALPSAPEPEPSSSGAASEEHYHVDPSGKRHYGFLSRVGIGADVSFLGVGIKGAVPLSETIDARLMGNFFHFTSSNVNVDQTIANGTIRLASLQAAVDFYPRNSIWRLSGGMLLWNGNQVTAKVTEESGQSFTLDGTTYYSANTNTLTGAGPVGANAVLGLHTHQPAFTVSGGFGRFIPRSERHWSFPSEFGLVFMGAPTLEVSPFGWVCTSRVQTAANCSDVADASTPVGAAFNQSLQSQLTKWRHSLGEVTVYPIFSYSVVYSFTIPGR